MRPIDFPFDTFYKSPTINDGEVFSFILLAWCERCDRPQVMLPSRLPGGWERYTCQCGTVVDVETGYKVSHPPSGVGSPKK